MHAARPRHANIIYYIDSFLHNNDVWTVMEYVKGYPLTDVITAHLMTEGQIKGHNVLLSLAGECQTSELLGVRAILRSCACKANGCGWYAILDGTRDRHIQGASPQGGYMVSWYRSYRYVSSTCFYSYFSVPDKTHYVEMIEGESPYLNQSPLNVVSNLYDWHADDRKSGELVVNVPRLAKTLEVDAEK